MRVKYSPTGSWHFINAKVAELLEIDSGLASVKVYRGIQHSLLEITKVLVSRFPSKTKSYYAKSDFSFQPTAVELLKSGYDFQAQTDEELELRREFAKESLFVLFSKEDVFFGIRKYFSEMKNILLKQGIIAIEVDHPGLLNKNSFADIHRNEIRLIPVSTDLCVAIFGKRLKLESPIAENMHWGEFVLDRIKSTMIERSEDRQKVEAFEGRQIAGAKPLLTKELNRYFDRAVINWTDIDATAIKQLLAEEASDSITTTSPSFWNDFSLTSAFPDFAAEQIRGTLILDHKILDSELEKRLISAHAEVLELQLGHMAGAEVNER